MEKQPVPRDWKSLLLLCVKQKAAYRNTLTRLRDLIHDLEQDNAQEQLAS